MNFGKSIPSAAMLLNLAKYFNCSTDYLLGRTDIDKPIKNLIINLKSNDIIDKYNSLSTENKKHFDSYLEFLIEYEK